MDVVVVGLARDNAATKQKPTGGGTVMRGQQTNKTGAPTPLLVE
jgi:hypothetical protein